MKPLLDINGDDVITFNGEEIGELMDRLQTVRMLVKNGLVCTDALRSKLLHVEKDYTVCPKCGNGFKPRGEFDADLSVGYCSDCFSTLLLYKGKVHSINSMKSGYNRVVNLLREGT